MIEKLFRQSLIAVLAFCSIVALKASDIVEVSILTNKIILLHFDDGIVKCPNELIVERLDLPETDNANSYSIISSGDTNYFNSTKPVAVYRKTKGTEFVKDAPWNNSKNSADPTSKPSIKHYFKLLGGRL
jgi:hypothetical protein